MKDAPEKLRAAALLLALPVEGLSVPVFSLGAFLVVVGGLAVAKFFLLGAGVGALATWLGVKALL